MHASLPEDAVTDPAFDAGRLERVFDRCFENYHTVLRGGLDEPLYRPARATQPACIHYREDFFASALHEVAHWCIAGTARRQQEDYGYWYAPDGRNNEQQAAFSQVEILPQALEWLFAKACQYPFRISNDNLDASCGETDSAHDFALGVFQRASELQTAGLPERGALFFRALGREFKHEQPIETIRLSIAELG